MFKKTEDINDKETDEILSEVNKTYGYDFTDYARASLQRRINRFMADAGFDNAAEMKPHLLNDKNVFDQFLQRITVNVTEMFRDPQFYQVIRQQVLPVLASYPTLKIWHAGC